MKYVVKALIGILFVTLLSISWGCSENNDMDRVGDDGINSVEEGSLPQEAEGIEPELEPESDPTSIIQPEPNISLPVGKCAFYGKVMWGDVPADNGMVIAETQNPAIIQMPGTKWEAERFTSTADSQGNYVLVVDSGKYYFGCSLANSDYITYQSFGAGLVGVLGREISVGELLLANFQPLDWSIKLISPGSTDAIGYPPPAPDEAVVVGSTPTLLWQEWNWQEYSIEQAHHNYYKISIELYDNDRGYYSVEKGTSNEPSYDILNPLQDGVYRWQVYVCTETGKDIAGTRNKLYFVVQ